MTITSIKRAGQQSDDRRERLEAYVEWLLTPSSEREPRTKTAFAAEWGVTTQTLRNYARDAWVQSELAKRGRAINKVERAGDVVDNLFKIATGKPEIIGERVVVPAHPSQVAAAKAFLEWTDKTTADLSTGDLKDMSYDDLREIIDDLERKALE